RAKVRVASATGDGAPDRIEEISVCAEKDGVVYVLRGEDGAVLAVPREAAAPLLADELALRSRKIFDEQTQGFTTVRVTGPRGVQRFERSREGAWELKEPAVEGLIPDIALLTELNDAVAKLSAERWIGAPQSAHGLEKPALRVRVETAAGKTLEIELGAE